MKKTKIFILIQTSALACALLFSAGCAGVNKEAAGKLATQGASVAQTIGQSYQVTDQDLARYVEGEYLLSGIKDGYSPPSDDMLKSIRIIDQELLLRQQMLSGLVDVYVSFGALCSYDAKGVVEQSLGNTIQAGNNLSTLLGGGEISASAGKLFTKAGGEIVGQIQSSRIKDASVKIRSALEGVIYLLQKTNEQAAVVAMREEISRGKLKIAQTFWTDDLALADGIFDDQVRSYGLTPNPSALAHALQNPGFRKGVSAILGWRQKQEEASQIAAYNGAIRSLKILIQEHVKIEAGEPVDLIAVQSHLAEVQRYIDQTRAASKGK